MMTEEIIQVRLEWPIICKLACKAMCMGIDLEELVNVALREELYGMKP